MEAGILLSDVSEQLSSLVERAASGVVQVAARHGRPITGTVFAAERVLVPAHAVEPDVELRVKDASDEVKRAEYVGADWSADLALLRVPGLEAAALDGAEGARVGQFALALGRTFSGNLVASAGIVSAIGGPLRTGRGRSVEQVLRADVRVHPLGAGGPLIDSSGRTLGVATGAMMRGMPLFIPASIAWRIGEKVATHGSVKRGYLGISAQPVRIPERQRAGRPQEIGLLVIGLAAGSPAEQAALLVGDLVVGFDGQPIEDHEVLLSLLAGDRVGKVLSLDLIRGGELRTVKVTVAERH